MKSKNKDLKLRARPPKFPSPSPPSALHRSSLSSSSSSSSSSTPKSGQMPNGKAKWKGHPNRNDQFKSISIASKSMTNDNSLRITSDMGISQSSTGPSSSSESPNENGRQSPNAKPFYIPLPPPPPLPLPPLQPALRKVDTKQKKIAKQLSPRGQQQATNVSNFASKNVQIKSRQIEIIDKNTKNRSKIVAKVQQSPKKNPEVVAVVKKMAKKKPTPPPAPPVPPPQRSPTGQRRKKSIPAYYREKVFDKKQIQSENSGGGGAVRISSSPALLSCFGRESNTKMEDKIDNNDNSISVRRRRRQRQSSLVSAKLVRNPLGERRGSQIFAPPNLPDIVIEMLVNIGKQELEVSQQSQFRLQLQQQQQRQKQTQPKQQQQQQAKNRAQSILTPIERNQKYLKWKKENKTDKMGGCKQKKSGQPKTPAAKIAKYFAASRSLSSDEIPSFDR